MSSQARASIAHRTPAASPHHASNASVGVHAGLPSGSGQVASRPAAAATSIRRAVVGSSSWAKSAAAFRSRTARAPVRRATGGWVPQWSTSSSTRRTASNAAPAAARSTCAGSRSEVATSGGTSTRERVVCPPRNAICTSPGTRTSRGRPGTSSPRDSSSSAGLAASAGLIARRAEPASASPEASSTCSSIARAAVESSASSGPTSSAVRPGVIGWSCESDPSASGTPVSARSPASLSHTRARSPSRPSAPSTADGSASRMCTSCASVACPDATRASRTESSRRVSRSRARFRDDLVAARDASCAQSAGAGVERSGRSRSKAVSRSSGQLLSWSASERCPRLGNGPAAPGADDVDIVPTLAVRPIPAPGRAVR